MYEQYPLESLSIKHGTGTQAIKNLIPGFFQNIFTQKRPIFN
jgi:hypothetical protein